jgi:hypothetical protein
LNELGNAVPLRCYDDEIDVLVYCGALQCGLGTQGVKAAATQTWMKVM